LTVQNQERMEEIVNVIMKCREIRQKDDIQFNHENKTVSYFQRRIWYYDAERSNGSLSDIITNLDPVTVVSYFITSFVACLVTIN